MIKMRKTENLHTYKYSNLGILDLEPRAWYMQWAWTQCAANICPRGIFRCFKRTVLVNDKKMHMFEILTLYNVLCTRSKSENYEKQSNQMRGRQKHPTGRLLRRIVHGHTYSTLYLYHISLSLLFYPEKTTMAETQNPFGINVILTQSSFVW